ncbi:hypothetical protein GCM10011491_33290 [Brucella endophytica]|uniref:Uncharacterized protein n=1 Tax=Brucella endophytica TaxID=1963359 RepID=A0A916SJN7_9HYPH|nr:hypothetical protein [Brucella endophytica]GGB02529.1 hypothetical protein GCM10011491_33290 [Brucella endophytica]
MPIRGEYPGPGSAYSGEDWRVMQTAYHRAAAILEHGPNDSWKANRLAREVMRLFNLGYRDVEALAFAAADSESNRIDQERKFPVAM